MTHREIQTASLMSKPSFHNAGASSLDRAARIEVCPSISDLAPNNTQTYSGGELSRTHFRRPDETSTLTPASMPNDHLQPHCKPDSIPI